MILNFKELSLSLSLVSFVAPKPFISNLLKILQITRENP